MTAAPSSTPGRYMSGGIVERRFESRGSGVFVTVERDAFSKKKGWQQTAFLHETKSNSMKRTILLILCVAIILMYLSLRSSFYFHRASESWSFSKSTMNNDHSSSLTRMIRNNDLSMENNNSNNNTTISENDFLTSIDKDKYSNVEMIGREKEVLNSPKYTAGMFPPFTDSKQALLTSSAAALAFPGTSEEFVNFATMIATVAGHTPESLMLGIGKENNAIGSEKSINEELHHHERPFVALAFANFKVHDMTLNWMQSMKNINMNFLLVALDKDMFRIAADNDFHSTLLSLATGLDGSNSHSSASWRDFAKTRLTTVYSCILLGYNCLHSDVDVVWLQNPISYLSCINVAKRTGNESCDGLKDADVLISSDNLSPMRDRRIGMFNSLCLYELVSILI